jgi:thiamine-monophosphate kinase
MTKFLNSNQDSALYSPVSSSSASSSPAPSSFSEKEFIQVFSNVFHLSKKPLLSGSEHDDCAALRLDSFCTNLSLESLTFSTDTVHESADFPKQMTCWQKGWMAAAVNFSDLAAMGSKPIAFLFSVGLPRDFTLTDAEQLALGIQDCVSFFGAEVIGGDTEFNEELTITGTVIGLSKTKSLLLRKNAKPGDLLCVTGSPGSAGVALSVLLDENNHVPASDSFLKNLTEPFPRVFEGMMLSKTGAVTSMIDTSDGLASSVYELSSLSGVCFEIDSDSLLNAADAEAFQILKSKNQSPSDCSDFETRFLSEALYTGGDFELLFTISPDKLNHVTEAFQNFNSSYSGCFVNLPSAGKPGRFPCSFTVIGKAIAESENVIFKQSDSSENRQLLLKKGYDSFKKYI